MDGRSISERTKYVQGLRDDELRKIYLTGINIHEIYSEASIAKRVLDLRVQDREQKAIEKIEIVSKQLQATHKEISTIVNLLQFFKNHWLPDQPIWIRLGSFLVGTIFLGIALNLAADWIAKFLFHW